MFKINRYIESESKYSAKFSSNTVATASSYGEATMILSKIFSNMIFSETNLSNNNFWKVLCDNFTYENNNYNESNNKNFIYDIANLEYDKCGKPAIFIKCFPEDTSEEVFYTIKFTIEQ